MTISKERLQEFIRLYEEEWKEQISEDEAREIASRLLELYQLLAEGLPSEINAEPPDPSETTRPDRA